MLRAEYLLELVGGKSAKEDKSVPPEVLSTALLLREEIQEARTAGDAAALESRGAQARAVYERTLATIAELARQMPGDERSRARLRTALNSIKYHQKLLTEL